MKLLTHYEKRTGYHEKRKPLAEGSLLRCFWWRKGTLVSKKGALTPPSHAEERVTVVPKTVKGKERKVPVSKKEE